MIEEAFNIRFDYVADRLGHDRIVDRLKRMMTTALRSESIRTVHKIHLIDRLKYSGNPFLDDFVLNGRQAQWTSLFVVLGDIHPFGR